MSYLKRLAVFVDEPDPGVFHWVVIQSKEDASVWEDMGASPESYKTWEKAFVEGNKVLYRRSADPAAAVIDARAVAMMNTMMTETLISGSAKKAELPGWQAAGKTGTSQDFRDAWFIGYTSNLVTGVWLGNDDNSPTKKATGGGLPVEIWSRFMKAAHQGVAVAGLPGGGRAGWVSNVAQNASPAPPQYAVPLDGRAPVAPPLQSYPQTASYPPPPAAYPPSRPAPMQTSARPEAAAGLDGWLMDRLFGR